MKFDRVHNTITGSLWGIINRIVCVVFPFFIRILINKTFGSEYLGLNSLFSSILQVLNLSELGLSGAIVYNMYKPVAENNKDDICKILNFYRSTYRIIGFIILFFGLLCLKFLPNLINDDYPKEVNIQLLYLFFLGNTCLSYFFFSYKEAVLCAYQRYDLINLIRMITYFGLYLSQILIIRFLKNYYYYTAIMIFYTLLRNIGFNIVSKKFFPEIRCKGKLSKTKKKDIGKIMTGAAIGKICSTVRNSFGHILISAYIGLVTLAKFDNYYYILAALISVFSVIEQAIVPGVGNSLVIETESKNYKDFEKFNFLFMWIISLCTICLACLYQDFMKKWMGVDLLFSNTIMTFFCVYFYTSELSTITSIYLNAAGLWWKLKLKSICEVVLNSCLTLLLGKLFGIIGLLISNIIGLTFFSFGWGSAVLFKNYFKNESFCTFLKQQFLYVFVTIIIGIITYYVCSCITINKWFINICIKLIISLTIPYISYILIYKKNDLFIVSKQWVKQLISRLPKKYNK